MTRVGLGVQIHGWPAHDVALPDSTGVPVPDAAIAPARQQCPPNSWHNGSYALHAQSTCRHLCLLPHHPRDLSFQRPVVLFALTRHSHKRQRR